MLSRLLPNTPVVSRLVLAPEGSHAGSAVAEAASVETKRADLVGAAGEALTDLRPVGKVRLVRGAGGRVDVGHIARGDVAEMPAVDR